LEAFANFVKSEDAGHFAPQILYIDATLSEATGDIGFRQIARVLLAKHVTYVLLMLAKIHNHICFVKTCTAKATTLLIANCIHASTNILPLLRCITDLAGRDTTCSCNAGRYTARSCDAGRHTAHSCIAKTH